MAGFGMYFLLKHTGRNLGQAQIHAEALTGDPRFAKATLRRSFASLSRELQTPMQVDDTTTLVAIDAGKDWIRFIYVLDHDYPQSVGTWQSSISADVCEDKAVLAAIGAG
ncbi:hypothetical protein [Pseudogemmobacter bohemicus]|uniref:hypothetical protein n=1 Tax=Pseudogemmobacter bohemicus TaxID=2250708 RepID=UPI00130098AF|nr:hypothetical protein [Pseudogemmobacter bohemicus]